MNLYWMIWQTALRAKAGGQKYHWIGWTLLTLSIPICIMVWWSAGAHVGADFLAFPVGIFMLQMMLAFFSAAIHDVGRPAQTCLVPQVHQHIFRIGVACWVAFTLIAGGIDGFGDGDVLLGMVVAGFMLNRLLWALQGAGWNWLVLIVWPLMDSETFSKFDISLGWESMAVAALLVTIEARCILGRLLGQGGDRHLEMAAHSSRSIKKFWGLESRHAELASYASVDHADRKERLAIGLGLNVPVKRYWQIAAFAIGLPMAAILVQAHEPSAHRWFSAGTGGLIIVMVASGSHVARQLIDKLAQTTSEQQLLCLAPGIARGEEMNRQVLMILIRNWIVLWGGVALCLIVFLPSAQAEPKDLRVAVGMALFALAFLPMHLLADYSKLSMPLSQYRFGVFMTAITASISCLVVEDRVPYSGVATAALIGVYSLYLTWRESEKLAQGVELLPVNHAR